MNATERNTTKKRETQRACFRIWYRHSQFLGWTISKPLLVAINCTCHPNPSLATGLKVITFDDPSKLDALARPPDGA